MSSNGTTAYVVGASNDETGAGGGLVSVNTSTHTVGKIVKLPNPIAVAVPQTGNTVYVLGGFDAASQPVGTPSDLYPVDTATGVIGKVIKVASNPSEIAVTPNGRDLYVLGANEVSPVVTATLAAAAPVKLTSPGMAIAPNSNAAYFLDPDNLAVLPLATAGNTRGKLIGTGPYVPEALAVGSWALFGGERVGRNPYAKRPNGLRPWLWQDLFLSGDSRPCQRSDGCGTFPHPRGRERFDDRRLAQRGMGLRPR